MQQIQQLLRNLIERQESLYEKVNAGDFSEVCYQEQQDEQYGTYDKNYTNRLRLAFYLFYGYKGEEKFVAALFEEELKDRETNSFQGIGSTLQYLTVLLREYNQEGKYDALFERAENANFDCACGFSKNWHIDKDINTWDVQEAIENAIDIDELDIAKKLIQIWQDSISEWDSRQIKELIYYNRYVGWEERNEELLEKIDRISDSIGKVGQGISKFCAATAADKFRRGFVQAYFGAVHGAYQSLSSKSTRVVGLVQTIFAENGRGTLWKSIQEKHLCSKNSWRCICFRIGEKISSI